MLIADWSPIPGNEIFQLHRISIPMGGRTITLYEECFEEKKLNNTQVHDISLDELEKILPKGCQPIILSDAIYKTPWFKRGGISKDGKSLYYSRKAKQPWLLVSHLPEAYNTAKRIVKLYRFRMQIEEGFRDSKNQQY